MFLLCVIVKFLSNDVKRSPGRNKEEWNSDL